MRAFLPALTATLGLLALAGPASADVCGELIDRVTSETGADLVKRSADFAEFRGADGIGMTLACGELSATGAQFRGAPLPAGYFDLLGRAGHAVTGIAADVLAQAGRTALTAAATTRHSNVDAGKVLVTCSLSGSREAPVTACAVIERDERR
ncbi:hypothetical protein ASF49_09840 [Methylobacterium sp. Leaf104]|uniref:hypothetical protein n=1 Tax=Methylobacterium TaxID=407 RepID=UPI0006F87B77|nr:MULTISPECIES: hypothetical protein [Methylobacterium]KQP31732.1 hypothetical protein ASF49_09840 [Methylobacterium sp. Leaf104]MCI9880645.1 hypothetical protein [Methylobacterium goesingense]